MFRMKASLAITLGLVLSISLLVAPPASATTETFSFIGSIQDASSTQTWIVPSDVIQIYVTARGGDGAGDTFPRPTKHGGRGAVVQFLTPVSVTPGATLTIYVAGRGDAGRGNNTSGKGGWGYGSGGQGGSGYAGGGGGGASALVSDMDGLLVVAGGGGGAGAAVGAQGGSAADSNTENGGAGLTSGAGLGGNSGSGGAAGTAVSIGTNPTSGATFVSGGGGGAGGLRSTRSRSTPFGGGGGGGYGGGGGGGGTGNGAGGGGGGSFSAVTASFSPSTLPWTSDDRIGNPGEITISTVTPAPTPAPAPAPQRAPVTVETVNFDSALIPNIIANNGDWIKLPDAQALAAVDANSDSTILGFSTRENFPVSIAQRQIDNGWGVYELFDPTGRITAVFIPVGGSILLSGPTSLYPIRS